MADTGAYLPFDQADHLGDPPWKPDAPAVQAWEAAHGHDVRLKCYVEFGCQAIENALDAAIAERDAATRRADKLAAAIAAFMDAVQRAGLSHHVLGPFNELVDAYTRNRAALADDAHEEAVT